MKISHTWRSIQRFRPQLFQLSVIGIMFAIGMWGHHSHWQLSADAHAYVAPAREHKAAAAIANVTVAPAEPAPAANSAATAQATLFEFPSEAAVEQLGIRTQPVERRPMAGEITVTGVVTYEPSRLAQISARVTGTVWHVEKQVGQSVKAGDVLAIIDAPALGDAKAAFLHAIADVQLCEMAVERLKGFTQGEVPFRQIQETETALRKARVDLFNSQQALISLGLSIDLEVWKSLSEDELQKRIKFLGLPESIVATLDPNSTTATLLPLAAPFDGVVIGRELAKGEVVAPGQGHLEIADVRRMWIVLHVREQDVDDLRLGQAVVFATGNDSVTGAISWMSTAVDEKTRTVEVRCETENPFVLDKNSKPTSERVLRANVFGVGTIHLYENKAATVVPTKAVQRFADGPIVFVPQNGRTFEMQNVQIGVVNPEYTEVLSGLTDSQSVVVDGSHVFKAELQRMRGAK